MADGLINSFDKTNLDLESSLPDGGIPYKQSKDPTSYPSTTNASSPIRGYFATEGKSFKKYDQVFSPKNTYMDFIKSYI